MRRSGMRQGPGRWFRLVVVGVLVVLGASACGGDDSEGALTTGSGADSSTATTANGDDGGGEAVPLKGASSCVDPTGDTDQEILDAEGWPDAFDLTAVELEVEGGELVVVARFAGDVTQDSRVDLYLGDLSGMVWDGQSITLDWDYRSQGWAAIVDTLPSGEDVVLPVATAEDNQLTARIPLDQLPKMSAPFDWFAFVSLADFCPDGNLQGSANNPATFPG
jgi:hypothetical protein